MIRIFIYLLATIAVVVSCTKTEVAYDDVQTGEITVSPVAGSITKAAITDGIYPTNQHIGMFAFHNTDIKSSTAVSSLTQDQMAKYEANPYFTDAEFYYNDEPKKAWGGLTSYYWPITGSLIFAGYSMSAPEDPADPTTPVVKNGSVTYDFTEDKLVIAGYTQKANTSETFDLLWFGRTATTYNNRTTGEAIPLDFNHALSWITFQVKGDAVTTASENPWKITSVVLNGIATTGDAECIGTSATWKNWGPVDANNKLLGSDMTVFIGVANYDIADNGDSAQELRSDVKGDEIIYPADDIENVPAGVLVIPQKPTSATIHVTYKAPAGTVINEVVDVPLTLTGDASWEAGKHYTYVIKLSPKEILVSPKVATWPTTGDGYVTEEKSTN